MREQEFKPAANAFRHIRDLADQLDNAIQEHYVDGFKFIFNLE
jgi:hypothetical protein